MARCHPILLALAGLAGCPCAEEGCADALTLRFDRAQLTPGPWEVSITVGGFALSCPFTGDEPLPGAATVADSPCAIAWSEDHVEVQIHVPDRVPELLQVAVDFGGEPAWEGLVHVPPARVVSASPTPCAGSCTRWTTEVDLDH